MLPLPRARLLSLNYVYPGEGRDVCVAHADWGRAFQVLHAPLPAIAHCDWDTDPGRPLRVRISS